MSDGKSSAQNPPTRCRYGYPHHHTADDRRVDCMGAECPLCKQGLRLFKGRQP